jgi:hypothetical protein
MKKKPNKEKKDSSTKKKRNSKSKVDDQVIEAVVTVRRQNRQDNEEDLGRGPEYYGRLKLEFFESNHWSLIKFMRKREGNDWDRDGHFRKNTNGWVTEKKEMMHEAYDKAIDELRKKSVPKVKNLILKTIKSAEKMLRERQEPRAVGIKLKNKQTGEIVETPVLVRQLGTSDLLNIMQLLKTEVGEPSRITKQKIELPDTSDKEQAAMEMLKAQGLL